MASGTRSGKQPASAAPDDGNSQDITTASPNQQLAIRAFSPEQDAALDQRFNDINASIIATNAKFDNMMRMLEQIQRQTTSSPILPSIETSPPAPAPPLLNTDKELYQIRPRIIQADATKFACSIPAISSAQLACIFFDFSTF